MKKTSKKAFLLLALEVKSAMLITLLALIVAGDAFAQRVGDTLQVSGEPYTIQRIDGDNILIRKVVAQGNGPVNWIAVPDSTFGMSAINGVAWGNNTWVAVGNGGKIAYSSDGRSWTAIPSGTGANQSTFGTDRIEDVAFGTAGNAGSIFIAVGANGRIASSTDGRTWTAVADSAFGTTNIRSIAFGGGRWVAMGDGGKNAYSTDGRTWTVAANSIFGRSDNIRGIAFGYNRWVAVGERGVMAYSTDAASWTAVANTTFPSNSGGNINAVAYGNGRFVAVSNGGRMAYCDW